MPPNRNAGVIDERVILQAAHPIMYDCIKRVLDLTLAIIVLVLGSPLWLLIALAIKLTSPGPVLFRGTVIGKGGVPFTYYKFRTMEWNSDDSGHRQYIQDYVQGRCKEGKYFNDDRITRVGRILRRTSLDEVPQLINVIKGEMSIVGPRPPVPYEYALYTDWHKYRLSVLPGITGLHQVEGRSVSTFEEMVARDIYYILHRSIKMDLYILMKTVLVMITGKGAY